MNKLSYFLIMALIITIGFIGIYFLSCYKNINIEKYEIIDQIPQIDPDYTGTIIPPNIAPLNFVINEEGIQFFTKIYSVNGDTINIFSKNSKIIIPFNSWKSILSLNRGDEICFDVYIEKEKGRWFKYNTITNQIAQENIDNSLVYRLIEPQYNYFNKMGIYQRNLTNFDESAVLLNKITDGNCMNCHSFCKNDPDYMMLHMRGGTAAGTLLGQDGKFIKINTGTKFNGAGAYPSWHPNGKLIAFSVNNLALLFHGIGENRDVLDKASDLIIYHIESNTVTTSQKICSSDRMETYPTWSPDGKYLYFCSSPKLDSYNDEKGSLLYDKIKYDLMRIRYYPETETWGEVEAVIKSAESGLSIAMPRISPDGRFLLFCMFNYGNFPIYRPDSDLYILNLETGKYYRLDEINSNKAETFHSWSLNSRWFVFSSKRRDGLCARPYFGYIDKNGKAYKPFLLPQKDPLFYNSFMKTYNVPELIKNPINVRPQILAKAAFDSKKALAANPDFINIDGIIGGTQASQPLYQEAPQ